LLLHTGIFFPSALLNFAL
jgi:hypothetical protein